MIYFSDNRPGGGPWPQTTAEAYMNATLPTAGVIGFAAPIIP